MGTSTPRRPLGPQLKEAHPLPMRHLDKALGLAGRGSQQRRRCGGPRVLSPGSSTCSILNFHWLSLLGPTFLTWGVGWDAECMRHPLERPQEGNSEISVSTDSVHLSRKTPVLLLCSPDSHCCHPQRFGHQASAPPHTEHSCNASMGWGPTI